MKITKYLIFLFIPFSIHAQTPPGMNEGNMQNMMQQMQKMQSCMANIDQSQLETLKQRSTQANNEINSLCANGKRDEAQEKAMAMSKEMMEDPTLQEMRKCGEMMQGMMPQIALMDQDRDLSNQHICD